MAQVMESNMKLVTDIIKLWCWQSTNMVKHNSGSWGRQDVLHLGLVKFTVLQQMRKTRKRCLNWSHLSVITVYPHTKVPFGKSPWFLLRQADMQCWIQVTNEQIVLKACLLHLFYHKTQFFFEILRSLQVSLFQCFHTYRSNWVSA